ncbi:MAG: cephalosporin hydroxylase family protein [Acidimicrobiales bacterium]
MTLRRDEQVVATERKPGDPVSIKGLASSPASNRIRREWIRHAAEHGYSYNFTWLGVPIIQYPEDVVVIQEILWRTQPDLVIETGIAYGGSLLLSASILRLLGGNREVLGIDVDIRQHARDTLASHPLASAVSTIEGDSVAAETVAAAAEVAARHERVLVILDSNHAKDHVAAELALYGEFVSVGSYLIVMDTIIRDLPDESFADRPWGTDHGPWNAVDEFVSSDGRFVVAPDVNDRLLASSAPGGYLLRTR